MGGREWTDRKSGLGKEREKMNMWIGMEGDEEETERREACKGRIKTKRAERSTGRTKWENKREERLG